MKIVIIGGVAGGATAAARLRRIDENAEIIVFEKDEYISYANCGLPYHIGNVIQKRDSLLLQTPESFKARFNVDVRIKSEVVEIHPKTKTVEIKDLKSGNSYEETYDKLVISTGAKAVRPPIKGIDNERIFSLRNIPDMDKIKHFITEKNAKKAVVIGGGFIGLEMAENLHDAGLKVTVIERLNQVMSIIDYSMAATVHQHLRSKNIDLLLGENIVGFETKENGIGVQLESNQSIETDMVILSIGVKPDNILAKNAGLKIGELGGIEVDEFMQTSDQDIYAVGDVIEVVNTVTGKKALIPLAGPANKQARITADNIIFGNKKRYEGTIGTSIAKIFDLTVASAGVTEKVLEREGIKFLTNITHSGSHAGYYPNSLPLTIKINYGADGKLFGAQVVGFDGVDKRIEMLAQVIKNGGTIYDLTEIEHAYAPPFSSAKDPVNMAGFVAENVLAKRVNIIHYQDIQNMNADTFLIDARTKEEYELGHIAKAINFPVDEIRERLSEIPKNKKIYIYCAIGLRGYIATRILMQNGFNNIFNLTGGYKTYSCIKNDKKGSKLGCDVFQAVKESGDVENSVIETLNINACGLQCPGPIIELKRNYDKIAVGKRLTIKVTDQAFGQDLSSWCNMVGANLISMENSGGVITATVEKNDEKKSCNIGTGSDVKTLIVFSDDLDKALATFVIANGILAAGKKVSIFFTFWGLSVIKKVRKPKTSKDFIAKMFGMMLPSSSKKLGLSKINMGGIGSKMMRYVMKNKNIDSLEKLMQQAIDSGAEMIACSMSMDVMGVKKEELIDNITIGGVASYLERADKSNLNLFI